MKPKMNHQPYDIIGDIHGYADLLEALQGGLGEFARCVKNIIEKSEAYWHLTIKWPVSWPRLAGRLKLRAPLPESPTLPQ